MKHSAPKTQEISFPSGDSQWETDIREVTFVSTVPIAALPFCFHLTFTNSNGPHFYFHKLVPIAVPPLVNLLFSLNFHQFTWALLSLSPIDPHRRTASWQLFITFHLFKWSTLSPSPRVSPLLSFCLSVSASQLIPIFIFTKWYCFHCRPSSCFHSVSLFTHSTDPHFTVFTVALLLVGLPLVNFSLQVDPFNSSQVSPICPHRPPPSMCHPHSYHQIIVVTRLLSV